MIQYIDWFLQGWQGWLDPASYDVVQTALCIAIPCIMTIAGVVAMIWAVFGVFGSRR